MWCNQYIGNKFVEKGRGPDEFDCWGLLRWVYMNDHPSKIVLPSYDTLYETTKDYKKLNEIISDKRAKHWVEVEKPKEFDAILLRLRGVPMHVGIVTKPGHMLHCANGINTVHERYNSMRWANKVLGFYHHE